MSSSNFDPVIQVLRALRDHDDVLEEELALASRAAGAGRTVSLSKVAFSLPVSVDEGAFFRAFHTRVLALGGSSWDFWFGKLEAEGISAARRGTNLGAWARRQRREFRAGRMPADRVRLLESVSGWRWEPQDPGLWQRAFSLLERYALASGTARVSRSLTVDGFALGAWVREQQKAEVRGSLSAEHRRLLSQLPGWEWLYPDQVRRDRHAATWDDYISAAQQYLEEGGNRAITRGLMYQGLPIGTWTREQRKSWRRGELSQDRARLLEQLRGWQW